VDLKAERIKRELAREEEAYQVLPPPKRHESGAAVPGFPCQPAWPVPCAPIIAILTR
jgi:hypothetical protein